MINMSYEHNRNPVMFEYDEYSCISNFIDNESVLY